MQTPSAAEEARHSAFAAAFFSFLLPGLGQAYLRHWLRALLWAAPWVLAAALLGGAVNAFGGLKIFAYQFADPSWLLGILVGVVIDLLYRLACLLDAYRLAGASSGSDDAPARRVGSAAGLVAILMVLVMSHVAVARPVYEVYDALQSAFNDPGSDGGPEDTPPPRDASFAAGLITPAPLATEPSLPPGATRPPATPTPTPEPTPTQGPDWKGGRLNILLIGADSGRADYSGFLTDTMIVVSIDPDSGKVAFITLPRDTQDIPLPRAWPAYKAFGGVYPNKINTLYTIARAYYPKLFPGNDRTRGFEALMGTLGELYNLDIKYYVQVDLASFRDVVNQLGGVVIDVQNPVYDSHYPSDDGRGAIKLYIPPGIQFMNGGQALAYARARHATSDFDRSNRQQRVITSVRDQVDLSSLLAPGVLDGMVKIFKKSVHTNIPARLLPRMIQLAQSVDIDKRISLVLTPPQFSRTCYFDPPPCPQNALYQLVANVPAIRKAVANVFRTNPRQLERDQAIAAEAAVVHVVNGTPGNNQKTARIADYLDQQGIDASVPPVNGGTADRSDYANTVITVFNGAEGDMPVTVEVLEKAFGVKVATADDPDQTADMLIVVGAHTPGLKPELE